MKLRTVLTISAVTTPLFIIIMLLHGAPLKVPGVTPYGIVNLELARTIERALGIYNAWEPNLLKHAIKDILIDFLFLISYGTFLYAACTMLSRQYNSTWQKAGRIVGRLMIVAAFCDLLENLLMLRTLMSHFNKEVIATTFIFASTKFLLVIIGILYIVFALIAKLLFSAKKLVPAKD